MIKSLKKVLRFYFKDKLATNYTFIAYKNKAVRIQFLYRKKAIKSFFMFKPSFDGE